MNLGVDQGWTSGSVNRYLLDCNRSQSFRSIPACAPAQIACAVACAPFLTCLSPRLLVAAPLDKRAKLRRRQATLFVVDGEGQGGGSPED